MPAKDVYNVVVTGAAGQIGYAIVPMIASGKMLGCDQKMSLRLLDIPGTENVLEGLKMELDDCGYHLVTEVQKCTDAAVAFKDADVGVMVGAFPRKAGMERKDLLSKNAAIFKQQGKAIKDSASEDIKILVVGNPANTNAMLLYKNAEGKIKPENITAMTRLDHNRATAKAAMKAGVALNQVKNVQIWGNHSATQVPDVNAAVVTMDGKDVSVRDVAKDDAFWDGDYMSQIQQRGAEVIKMRGASSAVSAAKAAVDHVHDWFLGTPEGHHVSMGVLSDGKKYGVDAGIIFSMPCTCKDGVWTVVEGLVWSDNVKDRIAKTTAELKEELEMAAAC